MSPRGHHRPRYTDPSAFDEQPAAHDPAASAEAAHRTASLIVSTARGEDADPQVSERLLDLVSEVGLGTVAALWADRPARSLPGVLWRLYVLREWVSRQPLEIGRAFRDGSVRAEVAQAIAGVADPPDPGALQRLADEVLTGAFSGDLALALERAGAFARVLSTGLASDPDQSGWTEVELETGSIQVGRAERLQTMAADLEAGARAWRQGTLV